MSGTWPPGGRSEVRRPRAARTLLAIGLMGWLVACGRPPEPAVEPASAQLLYAQAGASPAAGAMLALHGAVVSGTIEVVLVGGVLVDEVHFVLDASAGPLAEVVAAPFAATVDTTRLAPGPHRLRAVVAADRGGAGTVEVPADFVVENEGPPGDAPDGWTSPEGAVWIAVERDPLPIVAAHPAGTTFVFEAGLHRLGAAIVPRTGDSYLGEPGAVLSGARLLTDFERVGDLWAVRGQTQQGDHGPGTCFASAPRCRFPEELFVDDVRLRHVPRLEEVAPGTWFFDYDADTIYLADDPRGRLVETSVTPAAISGDADRVTVRGLTIEKFGNPAQRGAIMADRVAHGTTYGRDWVIEDNVVRWNHGVGIRAGHGAVIRGNRVIGNGQLGVSSVGGHGTQIEGNEIAHNNGAGFDSGWEAGGTKFVATTGLIVRDNHAHHNGGPGLWTDIDNVDTLYEGNLVEYNDDTGIFHEISYRATIRHNVVRHNGARAGSERYAYVFGAGILVYASADVEVVGNVVTGNWNGIVGLMHERGSGAYGRYELRGLHVHGNDVSMRFHPDGVGPEGERGVWGVSGLAQDGGFPFVFEAAADNRFAANSYVVADLGGTHFTWRNANRRFDTWTQTYGQDAGATIARGLDAGTLAARP